MPSCLDLSVQEIRDLVTTEAEQRSAFDSLKKLAELWRLLRTIVIDCAAFAADSNLCKRIAASARTLLAQWKVHLGTRARAHTHTHTHTHTHPQHNTTHTTRDIQTQTHTHNHLIFVAGPLACTYNLHKLLHLNECISYVGPMCRYWTYPFERMNLEATGAVRRKDGTR